MRHLIWLLILPALAQPPKIQNARLETRPAGAGLAAAFQAIVNAQNDPAWIGYAVPMVAGEHQMCCSSSDNCCGGCSLEGHRESVTSASRGPVPLEGSRTLLVLYRVEQRSVGKVRAFSGDCELDAGGLPFYWLTDVRPAESVALLAGEHARGAVLALSMHADPSAVDTLVRLARQDPDTRVRRDALFWLAQTASRQIAASAIAEAIDKDPDTQVKERAVFALSQIRGGEGVPKLIEVARTNRNPAVRKRAMFWLGQSKDPRAVQFFEEVLTRH